MVEMDIYVKQNWFHEKYGIKNLTKTIWIHNSIII